MTPMTRKSSYPWFGKSRLAVAAVISACLLSPWALPAFEGRITATLTRGGDAQTWLYTAGTNSLRIERAETNWPHAKNIVALDSGAVTLVFPHNRSFVRLKPAAISAPPSVPSGFPAMPAPPPGIGPQSLPAGLPTTPRLPSGSAPIGPTNLPGAPTLPQLPSPPSMSNQPSPPAGLPPGIGPQTGNAPGIAASPGTAPGMPMMPMMPMGMMEKPELKATGDKTNLLGFACEKFELKQRGEVMEIWATDKLLPFQPWLANQPPRFGPRMIEEQWGDFLKAKRLFPLRAVLRFEPPTAPGGTNSVAAGPERMRFEVTSVAPERIEDKVGSLFQPPPDYHEIEPLPF